MRKDSIDISDSSSLVLFRDDAKNPGHRTLVTQKSSLEISMDMLLGELSEIKADNGIYQAEQQN